MSLTGKKRTSPSRQVAVALGYEMDKDSAPRVLARGKGVVAEKILEAARQHDVPIRTDEDLAQSLAVLDLGDAIPGELYPAVAEVLAYVYRMGKRKKERGW